MTRQMADDGKPSLYEAIAVFDKSASRTTPNAQTEAWTVIRAAVAALQAERDALRKKVGELDAQLGAAPCRGANADGKPRCMKLADTESALEALRGQVAGLVASLRTQADRAEQRFEQKFAEGVADVAAQESGCAIMARQCADQLDALLAIKERMG